jgi:hypothetical protein
MQYPAIHWLGADDSAEDILIPHGDDADGALYRIAALPRDGVAADDVILSDRTGRRYLLSEDGVEPTPLGMAEADALGMFFEPSIDLRWHTLPEVRRMAFRTSTDHIVAVG